MTKLRKWKDFRDVKEDFDSLAERWGEFLPGHRLPRMDVSEKGENIVVRAEIPGLRKEDISLFLNNDETLTIAGKSSEMQEEEEENYYRKEIREGAFSRSIELPCKVDREKIEATYRGGVLEVLLPMSDEAKQKETQITIK